VVNACIAKEVQKLAYVSSTAALGHQKKQPIDESAEWKDNAKNSPYSASKYYSELEVWRGMEEGLTIYMVHPAIVLGEGPWNKSSARLFSRVYQGLRYYTPGANAYVDVKDVAKGLRVVVDSDLSNQRFLLAAENLRFKRVFEQISSALNISAPDKKAPRWLAEIIWRLDWVKSTMFGGKPVISKYSVRSAYRVTEYSSEKIKKELDFSFTPVSKTIERTARAFLAQHS
jgi:nucleoside-diphosphate-sugar epimerase